MFFICATGVVDAQDFILLRSGDEIPLGPCRILQVDDDNEQIKTKCGAFLIDGDDNEETILTKDIYMLGYQKRCNVYVNNEGKCISEENHVLPKDADIIYLIKGAERAAYDIKFEIIYVSSYSKHTNISGIYSIQLNNDQKAWFGKKANPMYRLDLDFKFEQIQ